MTRCQSCFKRWAQERGLCRTCSRKAGDRRTTRDRDSARSQRRALRQPATRYTPPPPVARAHERVIDGVVYEVTWDGTF